MPLPTILRSFPRRVIFHGIARPVRKAASIVVRGLRFLYKGCRHIYERYIRWLDREFPDLLDRAAIQRDGGMVLRYYNQLGPRLSALPYQPLISVLIPVYKVAPVLLSETLASVAGQIYDRWELCIVDDASGMPEIDEIIHAFARAHPNRVKYAKNSSNLHISATSNRALELATGDYVALLDHDDLLLPNALAEMVRFINLENQPEILYSDERLISATGELISDPFYKPDWCPYFHLSVNYTTHLSVYKRDLLRQVGGFRTGYEGSQDHDLMLRAVEATSKPVVHVPFVLYQWRAIPGSTASNIDEKPYAVVNGIKAVSEACMRRGFPAEVTYERATFHYRLKFALPEPLPLVSIMIPSKNFPDLIEKCLASITAKSTYPRFEILVIDNGSTDKRVDTIYSRYNVRVIKHEAPFNFAVLNNIGARAAQGDYLVLLNNDTEVITPEWIEELLRFAQLPDVGAVGCKLLYPDQRIQHAGALLVDRQIAVHALRGLAHHTRTYLDTANTVHEASAVTAACLMVSKEKYWRVGGLDEVDVPNGFGDVDFCLKLGRAKLSNIYTPYASLYHHESPSRGQNIETYEKIVMLRRWAPELMHDRFLNFHYHRSEAYTRDRAIAPIDPKPAIIREFRALPRD